MTAPLPPPGHVIAMAALWVAPDFCIRVQCECGWHETFYGPVTLLHINQHAIDHLTLARVRELAL